MTLLLGNLVTPLRVKATLLSYLNWESILVLILTQKTLYQNIPHPFIRQAKRYYKHKDGLALTDQEAQAILEKTRHQLGSELVETVILENLEKLETFTPIRYEMINTIINNGYSDATYQKVNQEIKRAIVLSRCHLYLAESRQKEIVNFKTLSFTNITPSSELDYNLRFQTGKIIDEDSQVALLVYKTNMPNNYSYIFLRHFIRQRRRRFYEVISF